MARPKSPHQDKFIVRLPDGMRDKLSARAKKNRRSMNAEVVEMIERVLNADETGVFMANLSSAREFEDLVATMNAALDQAKKLASKKEGTDT